MALEEPGPVRPPGPLEVRRRVAAGKPCAASEGLGWTGLEAARYCQTPAAEVVQPPLSHHTLILYSRPPEKLDLWYEGVDRQARPFVGSVSVIPAGRSVRWLWSGSKDTLHVYLDPELVGQVAAEAFGLDPAAVTIPLINDLDHAGLRAALSAVDAELTAGSSGGRLAAESLANVLAVHLVRQVRAPAGPVSGGVGRLPRAKLRAVVDFVEGHLHDRLTLGQLAAVARLSPYHFARQFKAAAGLPPHRYVIARRVERAKQFLRRGDLPLADVAASAGFSDQSQFCHHFRRVAGVTPRQFLLAARIA